jgi:hypothetical protein
MLNGEHAAESADRKRLVVSHAEQLLGSALLFPIVLR